MKLRRLSAAALLACVIGLGVSWIAGSIIARPFNRAVLPPDPPGQVIRLVASDGTRLSASYWPGRKPGSPAILLLSGINVTRGMFTDNAQWLNRLGYAVLALDFRGQGGSDAVERTFGWREADDARTAFAFLAKQAPGRRIGVIGVSMGGAAALLGRDGPLEADAMVLHAVYPDLRTAVANRLGRSGLPVMVAMTEPLLSYQSYLRYGVAPDLVAPIEGLKKYHGPVLVIGGTEDLDTTPADTRSLYAAAPGPKALWLVDGADHIAVSKLRSDEYRARLRRFFDAALGEPEAP